MRRSRDCLPCSRALRSTLGLRRPHSCPSSADSDQRHDLIVSETIWPQAGTRVAQPCLDRISLPRPSHRSVAQTPLLHNPWIPLLPLPVQSCRSTPSPSFVLPSISVASLSPSCTSRPSLQHSPAWRRLEVTLVYPYCSAFCIVN
ncbi:hypothetical protein BJY00DRAFT_146023 [Aspergillus carlsbadensis]|nr:hypothetical protein BJY00DRAFT_146023 [Aspergillus carlsbadensis]